MGPTTNFTEKQVADLSASIQEAVVDSLLNKTLKAAKKFRVGGIILAGGVAANERLREKTRESFSGKVTSSNPKLSVDNAAMIAGAAFFNFKPISWEDIESNPSILI